MSIFISYASENREVAELVAFAMRARGYDVFLDKDDLPIGGSFEEKIQKAIYSADLFIFLISPSSLTRGRYTLTELSIARSRWKHPVGHVLPVMVEDVKITSIPAFLRSVSVLQPEGDTAAEVCAEAAQLLQKQKNDKIVSAKFDKQILGFVIDLFCVSMLSAFFGLLFYEPYHSQIAGIFIGVGFIVWAGMFFISLFGFGQTPGDYLIGLRVVDEETGDKPRPAQIITWVISYLFLFPITWIWYFTDKKQRMLHNIASLTLSIPDKRGGQLTQIFNRETYNAIRSTVKSKDFKADFQSFQKLLDQIKPDRNTQFKSIPSQDRPHVERAVANDFIASPTSPIWVLQGANREGVPLRFHIDPNNAAEMTWVIGRQSKDCDFQIDQTNISRQHAEIKFDISQGLTIRDLASTNGTYLNGKKLSSHWKVFNDGDKVSIGAAQLQLLRS